MAIASTPCSPLPATTSACSCAGSRSFYVLNRQGGRVRALWGRARENRKFIQAPSPEIWSETISGGEEVLAQKWGGLFWATSLEKIFGGLIAIISFRPGGWMQDRKS